MNMDLEGYLKRNNLWYRFVGKPETIHTADAARVVGVELNRVTKNLVCETSEGEYVLLIIPGDKRVDLKRVAGVLKVKNVSLVPFKKTEQISGYTPGGTPSVGHKTKMRVVFDKSLLCYETIYCGGGSRDKLLELKTKDVISLNEAVVAEIST
jgi:Cys-tRNA(Pro) deacylase